MSEMDNQVSSHSIWKILVILTAVGVFVVMISFNGLAGAGGNGKIYLTLTDWQGQIEMVRIINGLAGQAEIVRFT